MPSQSAATRTTPPPASASAGSPMTDLFKEWGVVTEQAPFEPKAKSFLDDALRQAYGDEQSDAEDGGAAAAAASSASSFVSKPGGGGSSSGGDEGGLPLTTKHAVDVSFVSPCGGYLQLVHRPAAQYHPLSW